MSDLSPQRRQILTSARREKTDTYRNAKAFGSKGQRSLLTCLFVGTVALVTLLLYLGLRQRSSIAGIVAPLILITGYLIVCTRQSHARPLMFAARESLDLFRGKSPQVVSVGHLSVTVWSLFLVGYVLWRWMPAQDAFLGMLLPLAIFGFCVFLEMYVLAMRRRFKKAGVATSYWIRRHPSSDEADESAPLEPISLPEVENLLGEAMG